MDAIIGRYRVRIEENRLILKHPSGVSFDLLSDEALGLWDFIDVYKASLISMKKNTKRPIDAIDTEEVNDLNKHGRNKPQ